MNKAVFEKDTQNNKLTVTRSFNAPVENVWRAWTESEILDQWWAPKPYKAETKTMDFREGGYWLYAMVGPEGDKQWCRVDYEAIDKPKTINCTDGFCDEDGHMNTELPIMHWLKEFSNGADNTQVKITLTFDKAGDMEKILEMGFEEGFNAGLNNLEEYLGKN